MSNGHLPAMMGSGTVQYFQHDSVAACVFGHLTDVAASSICSPSTGLLCMTLEAAVGLFAGARRKVLLGIPMVSRLIERDQYEWLSCRLKRILPLLELQPCITALMAVVKEHVSLSTWRFSAAPETCCMQQQDYSTHSHASETGVLKEAGYWKRNAER